MFMQKVICDNNVWHRLANGEFIEAATNDFFVGTFVNIEELATSWELADNLNYIQDVYGAINKWHKELIYLNPIEFLLKKISPNYTEKQSDFQIWLQGIDKIM